MIICKMLNVCDLDTSDIRGVSFWECHVSRSVMVPSIIFGEFYFRDSKAPHETRMIKLSQKLNILQYTTENFL